MPKIELFYDGVSQSIKTFSAAFNHPQGALRLGMVTAGPSELLMDEYRYSD